MNLLLDHKADTDVQDDDGLTPLHLAAFNGSYLSTSFLLGSGANFRFFFVFLFFENRLGGNC